METLKVVGTKRLLVFLRYALVLFMLFAGLNHFMNPKFYLPLIPDYFPYPQIINVVSGALEVILSLFLLSKSLRKVAVYGFLFLLVAFIPSHLHFIEIGACVPDGLCTPPWVAWVRLFVIHPILLVWVWSIRKT